MKFNLCFTGRLCSTGEEFFCVFVGKVIRQFGDFLADLEEGRIALDELRDGGGSGVRVSVVVQVVEVNIVHALGDVGDPGRLLLLGGSHEVDHQIAPSLHKAQHCSNPKCGQQGQPTRLDTLDMKLEVKTVVLGPARPARQTEVAETAATAHTGAQRGLCRTQ